MKKYFILYRPFLLFLGKFFLVYFVLTLIYQIFLGETFDDQIDKITVNVAYFTQKISNILRINLIISQDYMHYNISYKNKITARIIEGCNAMSLIILFISFVFAFAGKFKTTLLYIFVGSMTIYFLNIVRIILLTVLMFYYPKQEHILHGVIFPLIVYGIVFILWIIWVNKFSFYATK